MRTKNLLKLAFTMLAMVVMTGAMAQITLTIKNSDGTVANAAVVYKLNSDGTAFTGTTYTADVNGEVTFTPADGAHNYIIRNSGSSQWNTYNVSYTDPTVITKTINLSASFTNTIREYVSSYEADKVTIGQTMPYWVVPSPVHNPAWTAPAADYASQATIETDHLSSFEWTATDLTPASTSNYVELTFATPGAKTITVTETAAAAYGGCPAPSKTFYLTAINVPWLEWNFVADADPNYTVDGGVGAGHVILSECESVGSAINVTLDRSDNTDEEYPYYVKLNYKVYNATISGTVITLGAEGTVPTSNLVYGDVDGALITSPTNPIILDGTVKSFDGSNQYDLFAADLSFPTINNDITVYEFDLATSGWNARVSRKSDYLAFRAAEIATPGSTDKTDWADTRYTWVTDDNSATNKLKAYVVILPSPVTGPIYHIPTNWAL